MFKGGTLDRMENFRESAGQALQSLACFGIINCEFCVKSPENQAVQTWRSLYMDRDGKGGINLAPPLARIRMCNYE